MSDSKAKFIKVLKAELEDLIEDIDLVEKTAIDRLDRMEITEYVFRENDALFHLEVESFRHILRILDEIDVSRYKNLDELVSALDSLVDTMVREYQEPHAVYSLFIRKMQKVRTYIDNGACP